MLEVDIIISKREVFNHENLIDYYENSNVLRLSLKSEAEYIALLQNPLKILNDSKYKTSLSILEKLKKFITEEDLEKLIKESTPYFELETINDLPIFTLKTKKKVFLNIERLTFKEIIEILKNPLISENTIFFDKYNEGKEMTSKELIEMFEQLLIYTKKIKERNLSQIEELFCIYNIVKEREYKEEEKHEHELKSRSLSEILNSDKIVCSGFANFMLSLCDILEIPTEKILWSPTDKIKLGHDSIAVYVNDPKYNIIGIYAIDPTWDSKENKRDNSYQNIISHFLVPMDMEETEKEKSNLKPTLGCSYYNFFRYYFSFLETPFLSREKELAFQEAKKVFAYLQIPFEEDLNKLYSQIEALGQKFISKDIIKQMVTTVTPKSNFAMNKVLRSCPYAIMEREKNCLKLIRLFKPTKNH